jgi:hypothetical protein
LAASDVGPIQVTVPQFEQLAGKVVVPVDERGPGENPLGLLQKLGIGSWPMILGEQGSGKAYDQNYKYPSASHIVTPWAAFPCLSGFIVHLSMGRRTYQKCNTSGKFFR